jgi:hypothetical protein
MNVLIIGSGGRESAFAHAIKKSNFLTTLFVAPGNGGTAKIAENVNLQENDFEGISHFCKQNKIELILIGPEVPLVNGIRDFLEKDIELKGNDKIVYDCIEVALSERGETGNGRTILGSDEVVVNIEVLKAYVFEFLTDKNRWRKMEGALKSLQNRIAPSGKSILSKSKPIWDSIAGKKRTN